MSRRRQERGSVAIEVVMLVPIMIFAAMLTLQLGVAGWTAAKTTEAAREAARANSLGRDPETAAERALPGALDVDEIRITGDSVEIRVNVPRVSPLPTFQVTRSVSMKMALP